MKYFLWLLMFSSVVFADKMVIAHRGASGYLPEHTLEAKVLAYFMNAPFIEQDLVMSKDDHLIVIHDVYLDDVSDVAHKFPNRQRSDGHFYVIDFTLAELKSLNMSEVFVRENGKDIQKYKDRFPIKTSSFRINTFEEEIELILGLNKVFNKEVGIYVETKKPWFHKQEGKDISKATLEVLAKYGLDSKDSPVYFQSFDYPDLVRVKNELLPSMNMDIKLIALIGENDWEETYELQNGEWVDYDFTPFIKAQNYAEISEVVDGIGPLYNMLFDIKKAENGKTLININNMVKNAHRYNLAVHPYTLRKDSLPDYVDSMEELLDLVLYKAGADGVFTDFPDIAVKYIESKKR